MQDDILSRALHVRDRTAAAALADPLRRSILLLCVAGGHGVAELAQATGTEIRRLHYHVRALATLGLLRVAGSRRRAGRPIKLYRACASVFFVSDELAPQSPSAMLGQRMRQSLIAARAGHDEGTLYHLDEEGEPRMKRCTASVSRRGGAATETWRVLSLSKQEAQRLASDVNAVFAKYKGRAGGRWLIHFALCPDGRPD